MLEPLRQLENVRNFEFELSMYDFNQKKFKLTPQFAASICDIKETIEGNWLAKHKSL